MRPLKLVVDFCREENLDDLLNAGVKVDDEIDSYDDMNIFMNAAYIPDLYQFRGLQNHCPDFERNKTNSKGQTVLHIGAMRGDKEFIEHLVEIGCDPSLKDNEGRTPEDLAGNIFAKIFLQQCQTK